MEPLRRFMAPLEGRIRLMLARAIVRLVNDASQVQTMQIDLFADEGQDEVERFQQYGFTSHPHAGAEAIAACIGGLRSHAVVIAVEDRRFRLTGLEPGEVALFDDLGNQIVLGRDAIRVTAAQRVDITAPDGVFVTADMWIDGNLGVTGTVTADTEVVADGVSLTSHVHDGVTAGGDQTGAPA